MTETYEYDVNSKERCWYKSVCDHSRCESFCIRHYKMDCLAYLALMNGELKYPIQLKLDKDGCDRDAYGRLTQIQSNMSDFVKSGKNLLIFSENTGNGKTEWAKKLMLSWFDSIWATTDFECRGLFISVPTLLRSYISNISKPNEYFKYVDENIYDADLVVWDEINSKDYTGFEHDYIFNVINHRISIGKANIFTTNYNLDTIEKKLGTRLCSRIVGCSEKIQFVGKDKRSWRNIDG